MTMLEIITQNYWRVSTALNHPDAPGMTVSQANRALREAYRLPPEQWRLLELMHVLKFDIIEGNTTWRPTEDKDCRLIPFTRS